jgi:hypothetical protein
MHNYGRTYMDNIMSSFSYPSSVDLVFRFAIIGVITPNLTYPRTEFCLFLNNAVAVKMLPPTLTIPLFSQLKICWFHLQQYVKKIHHTYFKLFM